MGLDMYLNRRVYIGAQYEHNKVTGSINLYKHDKPINIYLGNIDSITEHLMYWRKANAIHKWFVDNVQEGADDCEEYYVSLEHLKELVYTCKEVLKDREKAPELLPTSEGFFFGGNEYDEYYFHTLEDTIEKITPLLEYGEDDSDFYYNSSW